MYICACNACVFIWVRVHTKSRFLLNFCCNNLSKPTPLVNYEILHRDFNAFLLSGLTQFKVFLTSCLPTCCTRFYIIVVYPTDICIIYLFLYIIKSIYVLYYYIFILQLQVTAIASVPFNVS